MKTKGVKITGILLVLMLLASFAWASGNQEESAAKNDADKAEAASMEETIDYPTDSIDFLIPMGAGGSADLLGRAIASAAEKTLGEPVVPINKPGAGGGIMYTELEKSKPDGYTISWSSTSIVTSTNIGNVPFKYDAFDHVCNIGWTSMPIAVRSDAPWQTIEELAAYAKANPGAIKIGNAGTGSATHLTAVMFAVAADVKVVHVPLGANRRVSSLLGGEVEAICVPLPEAAPQAEAGALRILAVSTDKRDPAFPDVPTFMESGLDVNIALFRSIDVPKGTDPKIIAKLEEAFKNALEDPNFMKLASNGFNIDFMNSAEYTEYLADQDKRIAAAMKGRRSDRLIMLKSGEGMALSFFLVNSPGAADFREGY